MKHILFVPLNTNHVLIFHEILKWLKSPYTVLCHDKITGDKKYCTENLLKKKGIKYTHFDRTLLRHENDPIPKQLISTLKMKRIIRALLHKKKPTVIVLAVDNDPISALFLEQAEIRNIRTVIVQEGSARPEASSQIQGLRQRGIEWLRILFGIQLSYILHGTSNRFDKYLASGNSSRDTLLQRGVAMSKLEVTGQPKYDPFIKKAEEYRARGKDSKTLLYAAGFTVISDEPNRKFLKGLISSTRELNIRLTIKLHPRSSVSPNDLAILYADENIEHCTVIKDTDVSIALLQKVYGVITIASTVVTEALMIDREGILADYLAGEQRLPFGGYDAVHHINSVKEIEFILKESIEHKKLFENKKQLLEHNLYKLDGKAAERVAEIIEGLNYNN